MKKLIYPIVLSLIGLSGSLLAMDTQVATKPPIGNDADIVEKLKDQKKPGEPPIMTAARTRNVKAVEALLRKKAYARARYTRKPSGLTTYNKNTGQQTVHLEPFPTFLPHPRATALTFASMNGSTEIVKLLLAAGVDREDKNIALVFAAENKHAPIVKLLLKAGANVGYQMGISLNRSITALMRAAVEGDVESVELILAHIAKISGDNIKIIDRKNTAGDTALSLAALCNKSKVVSILLNAGANIENSNKKSKTPLMQTSCKETATTLLEAGAKVNARTAAFGNTPLLIAAINKRKEVIEVLISYGAEIDALDSYGMTALAYATKYDNKEIITMLLDAGADKNAKGEERGNSALEIAQEKGDVDILALFQANESI